MTIVYAIIFFLFGALLTSFMHLVVERTLAREPITGRSHCPSCSHVLRFVDVLPIVGYIINRGRCHFCRQPIKIMYPLAELLGGMLYAAGFLFIGWQWELGVALVMISVLLAETIADIQSLTVIDIIWIAGSVPVVVLRIVQGEILTFLLSSAVMFALLFLLALFGKLVFKKEALGGGDVKLYVFISLCLSVWNALLSLFLAAMFGLVFALAKKDKTTVFPLVPFIFLGVVVAYFFGDDFISWYMHLLGV